MSRLSPKIEIINHFDNLINRVDIDIDQCIEKYKEHQVLGDLKCFQVENRNKRRYYPIDLEFFNTNESSEKNKCKEVIEWSESTKVIDYLTQVRQRTIDELRKAQKENLEYLNSKSCELYQLKELKEVEEMKTQLFADKFYFQLICKHQDSWVFSLYTIVVDFYLSPSDIHFLECLINFKENNISKSYIFDEKFVLIHSLNVQFCENITTQQYPSHVISISKQDLLNIKSINLRNFTYYPREVYLNCSSSYLSKLESLDLCVFSYFYSNPVRIERLPFLKSLSLSLESMDERSFGNMHSLRKLKLFLKSEIYNDLLIKLFEICPNIEALSLTGQFSNVNLDSFINLKKLELSGDLLDDFNFDLFKNICNQLEELNIGFKNMDDESVYKLLYGFHFPNLVSLDISSSQITILEKKLFNGFPMLRSLWLCGNNQLKTIDKDAFSNMKNLRELELILNKKIIRIGS